jgi:hypothetical protein
MKVFDITVGQQGGPYYFEFQPDPGFTALAIASATLTITLKDGGSIALSLGDGLTLVNGGRTIIATVSTARSAQLTPRHDHPFKLEVVDSNGITWRPEGDGDGFFKPKAA